MVIAQIATIPSRQETVIKAAYSLTHQVDQVRLILNGDWHGHEGELIRRLPPHGNIKCILPEGREQGSDGWKFYGLTELPLDTIVLICDDDIQYPKDFARVMYAHIYKHIDIPAVYTVMGKIMKPRPVDSYYSSELKCFRTFEDNEFYEFVEIPGTCGMVFGRSDCPDLDHTFFKSMNSDVWMGVYCKQKGITPYVVPHPGDWLTNLMPLLPKDTPNVFDSLKDNDDHLKQLINTYL